MNGGELRIEETLAYANAKRVKAVEEELFIALNAPGRVRLWLIKRLFPEIVKVAEKLRGVYWAVTPH